MTQGNYRTQLSKSKKVGWGAHNLQHVQTEHLAQRTHPTEIIQTGFTQLGGNIGFVVFLHKETRSLIQAISRFHGKRKA